MSNSLLRKVKRVEEKKKQEEIKITYGKKPKFKCPKCNQKTLFFTNKQGEIFCIRCDKKIGMKTNK